ncbi:hypothetical protein [Aquabacterium sp. J223]|uniref:hypothetical protein n=1 Tax=Aquabacterium sp. J223 TaxID=2898431 RepID=UPI0021ADB5B7|nr:hypothetical protein [Aquabacterium sp. J223]UUX94561.1 hypothetical protein LRS07_14775 [Aquabacterium sp. J223]
MLPVIPAQAGVLQMASTTGAVATRCAMLSLPDSRFGIVMVGGGRDITALLFDLGEADVREWLLDGARKGRLPLIVRSNEHTRLLMLALDDDIERLAQESCTARPASVADLEAALQSVFKQLDEEAQLAQWELAPGDIERCVISPLISSRSYSEPSPVH